MTLGQENGVFVSNIVLYDLQVVDPIGDYDVSDGLVLAIGQQDDRLVTVTDTCLALTDLDGEISLATSMAAPICGNMRWRAMALRRCC